MTFKCHSGIRIAHTFAIVNHLNQSATGILYNYLNGCGTGIYCILYQFFNHRGGALNHLAGGNLVGH